ncbi:MAG: hypothetical protein OEZ59_02310 [Deltaproteobacteria bacterium]|nr:hypothetical protein [Deltaproteobacteria bacterium]
MSSTLFSKNGTSTEGVDKKGGNAKIFSLTAFVPEAVLLTACRKKRLSGRRPGKFQRAKLKTEK